MLNIQTLNPTNKQSLSTLKYIQNSITSHHCHCYDPRPTHLSSLVNSNSWPPKWSPCHLPSAFTFYFHLAAGVIFSRQKSYCSISIQKSFKASFLRRNKNP